MCDQDWINASCDKLKFAVLQDYLDLAQNSVGALV